MPTQTILPHLDFIDCKLMNISSKIMTNCISSFHSFSHDGKKLFLPSFTLSLQQTLPSYYFQLLIFFMSQRKEKQLRENVHKLLLPHLPTFICTPSYSTFSPVIKANHLGSYPRPTSPFRHQIPPSLTFSKQLLLKLYLLSHHHLFILSTGLLLPQYRHAI